MDNSKGLQFQVKTATISIGAFTYGYDSMILKIYEDGFFLNIGKFCRIASNVTFMIGGGKSIYTHDAISTYPFGIINQEHLGEEPPIEYPPTHKYGRIDIGHDVFMGYESLIMSGVSIGHGAKIGARSLVLNDVPPYSVVAGVPARVIKYRFPPEIIETLLELKWWDLPSDTIGVIAPLLKNYPTLEGLAELKEMIDAIKQMEDPS